MSTHRYIRRKASLESVSTPAPNPFKTRPFGKGFQPRQGELPETNLLQMRPVSSPHQASSQQQDMADLQTQLENAALSLNIYVKGEERTIDNGKYNALIVGTQGKLVVVRQSETDDILIRAPHDSSWTKVRSNFGGEIVGFGLNDSLFLLEVGLTKKDGQLSESRLLSIQKDGVEKVIAVGSIVSLRF